MGEKKLEEIGSRQSGEIEWTDFYICYILRVLYRVKRCSIKSMTTFLNNQIGQYLDLFVSHRVSGHFVPWSLRSKSLRSIKESFRYKELSFRSTGTLSK